MDAEKPEVRGGAPPAGAPPALILCCVCCILLPILVFQLGLCIYIIIEIANAKDHEKETLAYKLAAAWVVLCALTTCLNKHLKDTKRKGEQPTASLSCLAYMLSNGFAAVTIWIVVVGWNKSCETLGLEKDTCTPIQILTWFLFISLCILACLCCCACPLLICSAMSDDRHNYLDSLWMYPQGLRIRAAGWAL
jgi:hypothetical protein